MATQAQAAMDAGSEPATTGMPQLDFSTFPNQIFWLLVALVLVYLILSRVALPRIGAVLAERSGTITNDIAAAEELKLKAQDAEKAYNKALAEARTEAQRIAANAKAEIQGDLDKAIAKADIKIAAKAAEAEQQIAVIRAGAKDSVKEVAGETVKALVAALGGKADAATLKTAVAARMKG